MFDQLRGTLSMNKYYIKDEAFEKIFIYLRERSDIYCKNREKTREFLEGVYFIMRTGAQWVELPKYYGNYKSLHDRFISWVKKGIWNDLLSFFSKDYDGESFMIDGTIARAHACASGYQKGQSEQQALGRSKGGFTTKIHALVDALGLPLRFILTPGQNSEIKQAPELIKGITNANILGDKAFDCDEFIEQIESQNCTPIIPPRENRTVKREVDYIWLFWNSSEITSCIFLEPHQIQLQPLKQ